MMAMIRSVVTQVHTGSVANMADFFSGRDLKMDPKQFWLETNVRLKPQEIKVGALLLAVKTFTTFMIILRIGSEDKGCDNHRLASDEI